MVTFKQIKEMILKEIENVEQIFRQLGIEVITPEQMETTMDTDRVSIGHGLWNMNKKLRTRFVNTCSASEFLEYDTKIGISLGFA